MGDFDFTSIGNMEKNTVYQEFVKGKAEELMNGEENISVDKAISIFKGYNQNIDTDVENKIKQLAVSDGNENVSKDEMSAIYALFDMELGNDGEFHFDGDVGNVQNSGIEDATEDQMTSVLEAFNEQLQAENMAKKKLAYTDTSKYDRTKPFSEKVLSSDVDEVMLALQDKMSTGYTDKRTGKPVSITQAVVLFEDYVSKHKDLKNEDIAKAFAEETGISVSHFYGSRSGNSYTIGDWHYGISLTRHGYEAELTNKKTGETVYGISDTWENSKPYSIPYASGQFFSIESYINTKERIGIEFEYGDPNTTDSMVPTGAKIYNGGTTPVHVEYQEKSDMDPDLYNFID